MIRLFKNPYKFYPQKKQARVARYIREGENHGREKCLNIGAGSEKNDKYITIDMINGDNIDIDADIRTIFAPVYDQYLQDNIKLLDLEPESFHFIRMHHIVEHIEWIYQERLWDWVNELLVMGGRVYIETPNLEAIAKTYLTFASQRVIQKNFPQFPFDDHDYLSEERPEDITRWFNAKAFSGCSTRRYVDGCVNGDFHHCLYDEYWLRAMLDDKGFDILVLNNAETLSCIAEKRKETGDA